MAKGKQEKAATAKGKGKAAQPTANPYARRRLVAAIATIVSLIVYFAIPAVGYEAPRLVALVVFFVLIAVCTLFQQQYRNWKETHR